MIKSQMCRLAIAAILSLVIHTLAAQKLFEADPQLKSITDDVAIKGYYSIDLKQLGQLKSNHLSLEMPLPSGEYKLIHFNSHQLFGENFRVHDENGNDLPSEHQSMYFYISDDKSSYLLTNFDDAFYLVYEQDNKRYSLSQLPKTKSKMVLIDESSLPRALDCGTSDSGLKYDGETIGNLKNAQPNYSGNLEVKVIADYETYQHHSSSVLQVQNHISQLFAYVTASYNVINIPIIVGSMQINTSPDGYQNLTSCSDVLDDLRNNIPPASFTEHMVHLLIDKDLSGCGGIAYRDILCGDQDLKKGLSDRVNDFTVNTFPTKTLVGETIVHELGHNIGSPHTHACFWNGNDTQIDDCGNVGSTNSEGQQGGCYIDGVSTPILPSTSTLMSYCSNNTNQAASFHPQVASLLQTKYSLADCMTLDLSCPSFNSANYQTSISVNGDVISYNDIIVQNTGDLTITDDIEVKYYVSLDNSLDNTDVEIYSETIYVASLPSGYFYPRMGTIDISLITGIPQNNYYIIVFVDSNDFFAEYDESNNTFVSPNTYALEGCATHLTVTNATDPLYKTEQSIQTQGNIDVIANQSSVFRSQSVTLKPGFHANSQSVFRAHVGNCQN